MSSLLLGVVIAAGAAIAYDAGVALQALEARTMSTEHAWRAGLVAGLSRRRRWLAGTALGLLGWPLHAGALLFAPLTVVQPALAVGLIVLLVVGARRLGERVTLADVGAVAAILVGVAALALGVRSHTTLRQGPDALVALGALSGVVAGLWAVVRLRPSPGRWAPVLAGLCFAWSALSTQLVIDAVHRGAWPAAAVWTGATGGVSALGLIAEMTALQQAPVTRVSPAVFVIQVVVPVLLEPMVSVGPIVHGMLGATLAGSGLSLVLGAVVCLLRRSTAVTAVLAAETGGNASVEAAAGSDAGRPG